MQLGKSEIKTLTDKITLMEPVDMARKKKAGVIKVTVEILPRTEFQEALTSLTDKELVKRLVTNIESADEKTQVPPYTADLIDEVYEIEWQFVPIRDWVVRANSESIAGLLRVKN